MKEGGAVGGVHEAANPLSMPAAKSDSHRAKGPAVGARAPPCTRSTPPHTKPVQPRRLRCSRPSQRSEA